MISQDRGVTCGRPRRRDVLAYCLGAAAWPFAARAASPPTPIIGYLRRTEPIPGQFAGFREGLKSLGLEDGRTIRIEQRHAGGNMERLNAFAAELAALDVGVIAVDGLVTVQAAMAATKTIPIVFALASSPAPLGIAHLNRPGGNVTGILNIISELQGKRLELLKELIPRLRRVALLLNPEGVENAGMDLVAETAKQIRLEIEIFEARDFASWPGVFAKMAEAGIEGVLMAGDATFGSRPAEFAAFAAARRLPVIYPERQFVSAGGLISYGPDLVESWRQAAGYVAKILNGARPADLPIERPTKFVLAINLKASKALGLAVPEATLLRADEVIE